MLPCGRGRQGPLVINSPKVFFRGLCHFFSFIASQQQPMGQAWEMALQLLPRHMAILLPQMRSIPIRTSLDKMVI